ncbi:DUF2955 domain-containing protein [Gaetbulibacter saemankumensis]|uniref:DUF2955 domain-containing protein n=1 Tax=Gaetbulibacter saemankumensis TaxID=311208 RepID=UPI00041B2876|nr:DUF2955 domain-containing protein [Gaetbulibacter saemankumensis]
MFDKAKLFYRDTEANIPILRCVFGVTFALIVATSLGYLVPHVTAIFTLMFLQPNKKPLGLKTEIILVFGLFILGYFGVIIGKNLIDYPVVVLLVLGLIIFWSFRMVQIPQMIRLLFLILAVLIPFVSLKASALGSVVLLALLFNLIIAYITTRIAFFIFPLTPQEDITINKATSNVFDKINLDKMALNGLFVVFPFVFVCYLLNATVAILTLVYVMLLSFDPFIHESKKAIVFVIANILGGLAGILVYNILVIAPSYVLYILLTINVAFYFVIHLYSNDKKAPIYKSGFNAFFVIMGTISTSTSEAGNTVWGRLIQVSIAIIYVVLVSLIVNTFNNPKLSND